MGCVIVKTWDGKNSLTMDNSCFILRWAKEEKTIPLAQVISLEVKDPRGKLHPGMITLRLAGTSGLSDRVAAFVFSTGPNSIGFPHGYAYIEEGREMQRRFMDFQNKGFGSAATHSSADEIRKYKELLDIGAITQEEYDFKKKEILGI